MEIQVGFPFFLGCGRKIFEDLVVVMDDEMDRPDPCACNLYFVYNIMCIAEHHTRAYQYVLCFTKSLLLLACFRKPIASCIDRALSTTSYE
jgi:hypothetical protein